MAVHRIITEPGIYYLTFTCHRWLSLIEITNAYALVYDWFDILKKDHHDIVGYVIMPNHTHLILHFSGACQSLNTIVGNGKRFIAYEIVERLLMLPDNSMLNLLKAGVRPKDKARGKKHEVWQDTFDVKECRTESFILEKLNYIHNNPCTGKWKLAKEPHQYSHSSALFYLNGKTGMYPVRDYREFLLMYRTDE